MVDSKDGLLTRVVYLNLAVDYVNLGPFVEDLLELNFSMQTKQEYRLT
jgi:ATP-dependent Clp protease adapter protein ClpS